LEVEKALNSIGMAVAGPRYHWPPGVSIREKRRNPSALAETLPKKFFLGGIAVNTIY
jgi:hypothetical protein